MEGLEDAYEDIRTRIDEKCEEMVKKIREDCKQAKLQLNDIKKKQFSLLKNEDKIMDEPIAFFKEAGVSSDNLLGMILEKHREDGPTNWIPIQLTKINKLQRILEHEVEYKSELSGIFLVGNEIWAVPQESNEIYEIDVLSIDNLEKLRTFELECEDVISVVDTGFDMVLVTARSGLFHTNSDGQKPLKLIDGCIPSATMLNDTVYALCINSHNDTGKVSMFKRDRLKRQFNNVGEFELENYDYRYFVTLQATSKHLFNTDFLRNSIYQYTLDGKLIKTHKFYPGDNPGDMDEPFIAGVDGFDNLLIADTDTNRFQIMTSTGKCTVLEDDWPKSFKKPRTAVIVGCRMIVCNNGTSVQLHSLSY